MTHEVHDTNLMLLVFLDLKKWGIFHSSVTGKGMRHSPIKNGNVTSFFAMDAPRSLSDFYDHFGTK